MMQMIDQMEDQRWRASATVIFSEMDGGVALLDTRKNIYFSLEGIGPFLWSQLCGGADFATMCLAVTDHYDVDAQTARDDIADWMASMVDAGLIEACG